MKFPLKLVVVRADDLGMNHTPSTSLHTERDHAALVALGIDPEARQNRERPTSCRTCGRSTWHITATCDAHYQAP